jgi:hypothetical protein
MAAIISKENSGQRTRLTRITGMVDSRRVEELAVVRGVMSMISSRRQTVVVPQEGEAVTLNSRNRSFVLSESPAGRVTIYHGRKQ